MSFIIERSVPFQSARPHGARPLERPQCTISGKFQSARPHGARHWKNLAVAPIRGVSIRAPAWGATSSALAPTVSKVFQSARPHGARQVAVQALRKGLQFQSARPHGARQIRPALECCKWCFNPRARMGRDRIVHVGHTCTDCFNPRARMGRDQCVRSMLLHYVVSIRAPAWGATRASCGA